MDRVEEIRRRLTQVFAPTRLDIIDQSHLHAGHVGSRSSGGGHYTVSIIAPAFKGKTALQRHRMVYDALGDLMRREVHALTIKASHE